MIKLSQCLVTMFHNSLFSLLLLILYLILDEIVLGYVALVFSLFTIISLVFSLIYYFKNEE